MSLTSAILTLVFVMDPLGNVPLFLAVLKRVPARKRQLIIIRESFIAFIVLIIFLFFGQLILEGMHITEPALAIAGGIILFLIALRMIFPPEVQREKASYEDPFIVPLAVPLIAGPSTMTMVMVLANQEPENKLHWLIALAAAWFITTTILVFADNLRKILGDRGLAAMERLMGMILTTMAVQMLLSGIQQFLKI